MVERGDKTRLCSGFWKRHFCSGLDSCYPLYSCKAKSVIKTCCLSLGKAVCLTTDMHGNKSVVDYVTSEEEFKKVLAGAGEVTELTECLPSLQKVQGSIPMLPKLGMVGVSEVQGHFQLLREFEASLDHRTHVNK